ncbi:FAD-dependent oxidoreductase [Pedobacter sp. KR3-3]|uniref:FAD-dependent oxidoreductase n=1 Tax=Pedobacter albus TaxID=3113905 RepID=A0ABU7IAT8_9SPHI|nr:FAD-dependent oxidoreductase [Pedobacter sp. KR3-3]MEE1946589.1 FAD-dependent oxidoreductase [Pedobacter sp. KR3-3]
MNIRSNEPYWLVKNGILHAYPSLRTSQTCEVLIVGGGITGALMAHSCVKNGLDTVLVDKREIANGSTLATTSMLQYEIDVPLYQLIKKIGQEGAVASYKACRDSIGQLAEIVQEVQSACGFEAKESLYFAHSKKDAKWLRTEFETRLVNGFEVDWLTGETIKQRYGLFADGGILSADGASVDAFCLTHDLLHYNAQKGLQVYDKTELKKVKYESDHVLAQMHTGASVKAKHIIYCTGYETQELLPNTIVKLKSTYAMVSERMEHLSDALANTLFWNTDTPYLYMRSTADGRLLVGGEDENFKNALKRDALLDLKQRKLFKTFQKLMPDIHFITDFSWCGTFGETKDGLPYIGTHPKFRHSYFCLGFGGNGITFSVIGAQLLVQQIKGKTNPLAHYFRFGR